MTINNNYKSNDYPQLDFQAAGEEGDTGTYISNGEWELIGDYHHHNYEDDHHYDDLNDDNDDDYGNNLGDDGDHDNDHICHETFIGTYYAE